MSLKEFYQIIREITDSAISYLIGFMAWFYAAVVDNSAGLVAFGGVLIITLRVAHDFIKLKKAIKK